MFELAHLAGIPAHLAAGAAQLAELEGAAARFRLINPDAGFIARCMAALHAELARSTTLPTPNLTISQAFEKVYTRVAAGAPPERPMGGITEEEMRELAAWISKHYEL